MRSSGSSSELEKPDGGALTPLKVEIKEFGFPSRNLENSAGESGGVVCEKATYRVIWEL